MTGALKQRGTTENLGDGLKISVMIDESSGWRMTNLAVSFNFVVHLTLTYNKVNWRCICGWGMI